MYPSQMTDSELRRSKISTNKYTTKQIKICSQNNTGTTLRMTEKKIEYENYH